MSELPPNWASVRINEICDTPKEKGEEGIVPYLEIGNVNINSKEYALTDKPSVKGCRVAQKHDVLVSRVRPTRGAITWIRENELLISSAFTILRNKGALAEKYLWRYLAWNRAYLNHLGENCTGTMYPTTSADAILDFEVPLAPFPEQGRIVAKLEAVLSKLESSQKRLAQIPVILKRLRQSVLAAACSGRLTADWREENKESVIVASSDTPDDIPYDIPTTWGWIKWGALVAQEKHSFKRGPFGSALKKGIFVSSGYKVYEQCNPINDDCDLGHYYVTKEKFQELEAFKVHAGDLLISCSGVTLGRITQIPQKFKEGIINQALLKVTLDKQKILNDYFIKCFRSKKFQKLIFEGSQGSAQPNIKGVKELKAFPVPLPPLTEQHEIVRRVESLFALADQIETRFQKAQVQVEKLTPSILAKAFRGELVPQDPSDEPASVLLQKIKSKID